MYLTLTLTSKKQPVAINADHITHIKPGVESNALADGTTVYLVNGSSLVVYESLESILALVRRVEL